WVISFWMALQFDHCAGKTGYSFHSNKNSNFDGAQENQLCILALLRVQRVSIERANCRDTNVVRPRLAGEVFCKRLPILFLWPRSADFETIPTNRAKAIVFGPIEARHICVCNKPNPHLPGNFVPYVTM